MHPYNTQEKLLRYARENEIATMAFSNLGAPSYVPLGMAAPSDAFSELEDIKQISAKYNKTAAQVVLRWGV